MTDLELLERYKHAQIKSFFIATDAVEEKTGLQEIVDRLRRLGIETRGGVIRALGVKSLREAGQADIDKILHKYGKKPPEDRTGCVDSFCSRCRYLERSYGYRSCSYYIITRKRRGCPAGQGCSRFEDRKWGRRGAPEADAEEDVGEQE